MKIMLKEIKMKKDVNDLQKSKSYERDEYVISYFDRPKHKLEKLPT